MTATDPQHLSAIAHADSMVWGPIGAATLDELVNRVGRIVRGGRIIDLGCGAAELLRRLCETSGASGLGIDASPYAIEEARRRVSASAARDRIHLRLDDVAQLEADPSFDVVVCLGPGWETGGWATFARWIAEFVKPGGHVLIADLAWRAPPDPEALEQLGMATDELPLGDEVEQIVRETGLEPIWSHRATPGEWEAYATSYRGALRRFAAERPDHPIAPAVVERAEAGWARYERMHALLDFVIVLAPLLVSRADRGAATPG